MSCFLFYFIVRTTVMHEQCPRMKLRTIIFSQTMRSKERRNLIACGTCGEKGRDDIVCLAMIFFHFFNVKRKACCMCIESFEGGRQRRCEREYASSSERRKTEYIKQKHRISFYFIFFILFFILILVLFLVLIFNFVLFIVAHSRFYSRLHRQGNLLY